MQKIILSVLFFAFLICASPFAQAARDGKSIAHVMKAIRHHEIEIFAVTGFGTPDGFLGEYIGSASTQPFFILDSSKPGEHRYFLGLNGQLREVKNKSDLRAPQNIQNKLIEAFLLPMQFDLEVLVGESFVGALLLGLNRLFDAKTDLDADDPIHANIRQVLVFEQGFTIAAFGRGHKDKEGQEALVVGVVGPTNILTTSEAVSPTLKVLMNVSHHFDFERKVEWLFRNSTILDGAGQNSDCDRALSAKKRK